MIISNKPSKKINSEMFGLFFEDINFAADGGLYAEMIENRSFEAREAFGIPGKFYTVADYDYAWSAVYADGESAPRLQVVEGTPLSEVNPHYLRFTAKANLQGFKNKAYDGIALKKGMKYKVSFYARCVQFEGESLLVEIKKQDKIYASGSVKLKKALPYAPYCDVEPAFTSGWTAVDKVGEYRRTLNESDFAKESEWLRYDLELISKEDITGADFVIKLDAPGVVEFDLISMMPEDAVCGIFRRDLFEALKELNPGFIRFPGGCIVEGISLANRYQWENTVGDIKDRKYTPNLWAFNDSRDENDLDTKRPDSHYGQSYGIGFYEYFLLCELLGAKPLPVVGIGAACQFRSDEMTDIDDPMFFEYIREALELIEFANGSVDSVWGSVRADMGHPEPFNLEFLAVGNEQWETKNIHLFERLEEFEAAIHSIYPDILLLGTAGPGLDLPMANTAWEHYRSMYKENTNYCYAVDEHYYVSSEWMYDRIELYDSYPREVGVFAGEYAAHPSNRGNNIEGALAEAAFLTGIEKNADVVKLASYAPLFNRIGHSQWKPDMIWFDDTKVYLTPNYYVQKLFMNNVGDYTVDMHNQEKELRKNKIYVSLTCTNAGELILKAANCGNEDFTLDLTDENNSPINAKAEVYIMKANGDEVEGMPQPAMLQEDSVMINGCVTLEAQTFNAFRFAAK